MVMLNCASKATIRPLTVTGVVTESPTAGESTSATSVGAGSGLGWQTFGAAVGVGDSSPGAGETVAPGVMSTPSPFLQATSRATAHASARSNTYFISALRMGKLRRGAKVISAP